MRLKRKSSVNCRVALVLLAAAFSISHFLGSTLNAQVQSANKPATAAEQPEPIPNAKQPYLLSSRLHLQTGSNKGYLVVRVDLAEGSHIYSLTQKGSALPTKLTVTPSNKFRLLGGFTPDRPAEVTVDQSDSKQTLEKHKSMIQFFAPIEVAQGTDTSTLTTEVLFKGQVCTAENFCMPIMGEKVAGKFAGYFQDTAKDSTDEASRSARAKSGQPESSRVQR